MRSICLIFIVSPFLTASLQAEDAAAQPVACAVCVVGGGSGGFGAALAAARAGVDTVLVEKQAMLGGTSTAAFVSNWEPGPGCSFAREVYALLAKEAGAAAIAPRTHAYTPAEPYGLCLGDPRFSYEDSLCRAGVPLEKQCSVVMRPESLAAAMATLLRDAGVRVYLNTAFQKVEISDGVVRRVTCVDGAGNTRDVQAKVFIDATGGASLCQAAGCEMMLGEEGQDRFNEPSAPPEPRRFLNGISLCYRIARTGTETAARNYRPGGWFFKVAFIHGVDARGDTVNTLALLRDEQSTRVTMRRWRLPGHAWPAIGTGCASIRHFRNTSSRIVLPCRVHSRELPGRDGLHSHRTGCSGRARGPGASRYGRHCGPRAGHPRRRSRYQGTGGTLRSSLPLSCTQGCPEPAGGLPRGRVQPYRGFQLPSVADDHGAGPCGGNCGRRGRGEGR